MKTKLKLTLLSDTMIGSGVSIKGVVDNDIVYDDFGIPYIPAKRIYGILRESAEELNFYDDSILKEEDIIDLFGKSGNSKESLFYLSNGYIDDYEKLNLTLSKIYKNNSLKTFFPRETIIENYSYIRNQTAIENGVAKENSLRSLRVLKKGLVFYFEGEFPEEYKSKINTIIKYVRNIGSQRTRGYGEIKLEMEKTSEKNISEYNYSFEDDDIVIINVEYTNIDPIMVFQLNQDSQSFISGSNLLGFFANKYIKYNHLKNAHKDKIFKNLFLNGNTIFSNAYPVIQNNRCYVTPLGFKVIKNTNNFVDMLTKKEIKEQLSSLGTEFIYNNDKNIYSYNVSKEIIYHHKRPVDKGIGHVSIKAKHDDTMGAFYQVEVIKKNQKFKNYIVGKWEHLKHLSVNKDMIIRIGRSKKTQYGRVKILNIKMEKVEREQIIWKSGSILRININSDYLSMLNQNNMLVSFIEDFILANNIDKDDIEVVNAIVSKKKLTGFNALWKLPKLQLYVISAGSEILLKNKSNKDLSLMGNYTHIGDLTNEGLGEIKINIIPNDIIINKISDMTEKNAGLFIPQDLLKSIIERNIKECIQRIVLSKKIGNSQEASKTFVSNLLLSLGQFEKISEMDDYIKTLDTEKQKKNLDYLKDILFIENNSIKVQNFYSEIIESDVFVMLNNKELEKVYKDNNVNEKEVLKSKIDIFYKYYVEKILTKIKYKQRKQEG